MYCSYIIKYRLSSLETIDHIIKSPWELIESLYRKPYPTNYTLYLIIPICIQQTLCL